jgi:bifunctional DNA-binding transcriptional regulator/antitoxin component of YhaV-PrlF toxin-antitoxin module
MKTAHLSNKRHIIIPTDILESYHLQAGQQLDIEITAQGILLKLPNNTVKTNLDDLIGCTAYQGQPKTLEEMDSAIEHGIIKNWGKHDSD